MDGWEARSPAAAAESDHRRGNGSASFYQLNANQSSSSIFEDVEMAQDEVCCS